LTSVLVGGEWSASRPSRDEINNAIFKIFLTDFLGNNKLKEVRNVILIVAEIGDAVFQALWTGLPQGYQH
jgi:hypothetical protein